MKTKIIGSASLIFSSVAVNAALVFSSPLDGNADAIVGTSGIANGTPMPTTDLNGNVGGAVQFNGTTDYFNLGDLGSFTAGSLSAWVRTDTNATERGAVAVGASGGGTSVYFSFMNNASGQIRVDLDDGVNRRDVQNATAMVVGQWYHIAATFDAGGTFRLYTDGVETNTESLAGDNSPYAMSFDGLIGAERTTERFWEGAIDDVRIWDNELSAAEVGDLFASGPVAVPEPSVPSFLGLAGLALIARRRR